MHDLLFGLRMLRKEPGLALAAALSIAIGIAASTTVFSVVNRVLFTPLPVEDGRSLMAVSGQRKGGSPGNSLSWPDLDDLRAEKGIFQDVAGMFPVVPASLTQGEGTAKRLWGHMVTGNFFAVSRAPLMLGRGFRADEDQVPGRDLVVVLSHHVWAGQLGADRSIVGRTIRLNQREFTVVGVTAPGFRGTEVGLVADFWIPFALQREMLGGMSQTMEVRHSRDHHFLMVMARLQPGVTRESAQAALDVMAERLGKAYPATNKDFRLWVEPAGQISPAFRSSVVSFLSLLLVVMMLVLGIACANVANLLLARAAKRQREIGTRLAVGAGRGRLIRQLLTESLLLAALGTGLSVVLTRWAQVALGQLRLPVPVPIDFTLEFDWRVTLFATALTVLTTLAFGLAPAFRATKTDLMSSLRVHSASMSGGRRRLNSLLVCGQVAVAVLLLAGSVLVLRSLQNTHRADLGLRAENLLLVTVDPALDGVPVARTGELLTQISSRLRGLPGVETASYTDLLPLSFGGQTSGVQTDEERAKNVDGQRSADYYHVGDDYVGAMGMQLLRGTADFRSFRGDTVPTVINETFARKVWPDRDALGQRFYRGKTGFTVIGVARDSKSRTLQEDPRPVYYAEFERGYEGQALLGVWMLVRTSQVPHRMAEAVRKEMRLAFPNVSVFQTQTMEEHVNEAQILPRMAALVFGFAGGAALLLSLTGLFGVISYSVSRRTREIGIRMALGASQESVLGMVLRQGLVLSVTGLLIGLAAALASTRVLVGLLYGVSPTDAVTFTVVPLLLLATSLVASLIPARRASRLAPLVALREE
jgi:predicted permease